MKPRIREDFQLIADKGGYMIYYKGHGVSGVGTLSKGKDLRGRAARKQTQDYFKQGEREIEQILEGKLDTHQKNRLTEIDKIFKNETR
jgi:hypothetical protein